MNILSDLPCLMFDTDYRAQQRQEAWPDYYAARLLECDAARHQTASQGGNSDLSISAL
ncbi:MAG TPA: hypothetical protein VE242_09605 [Chthoniobacterales bacterium]|nr:hypothetical protein [Chthoniobacterales bacterium]